MIIQTKGTEIYCEESGSGDIRVVLLHGWGCSADLMKPVADGLNDCCRVLSVDFPGHGKSGRPPEPWGVPEYAEALKETLEKLNWFPCAVIGHSFGCRVAAYLASGCPELFTKIVMTGAAGIRPPQSAEAKKRSEEYRRYRKMAETVGKLPLLSGVASTLEDRLRKKYGSADYNALDEEMRKTFVKVISLDLTDRYPLIRQPVLLLWGDKDTETPLWMGRKMEEMIPDSALILLEGGTHFAYLEQISRFRTIIRQFLTEG